MDPPKSGTAKRIAGLPQKWHGICRACRAGATERSVKLNFTTTQGLWGTGKPARPPPWA